MNAGSKRDTVEVTGQSCRFKLHRSAFSVLEKKDKAIHTSLLFPSPFGVMEFEPAPAESLVAVLPGWVSVPFRGNGI